MFMQVNQLAKIHYVEWILSVFFITCYVHLSLEDVLNSEVTWEHLYNRAIVCCELLHIPTIKTTHMDRNILITQLETDNEYDCT